jgi:hypothetical protein
MKLKIYFISAVVFILQLSCESYPQTNLLNNFKLKENSGILNDSQKTPMIEKSLFGAGFLSFFIPGLALGQFYNGQENKAFIHIAVSAGLITFTIIYTSMTNYHFNIFERTSSKGSAPLTIAVIAFIGNWLWSITDAVISAHKINEQVKLQKYSSDILNKIKLGLSFDKNKNLNLKFSVSL